MKLPLQDGVITPPRAVGTLGEASLRKRGLESCTPGSVCAEHSDLTSLGRSGETGRGVNETVMKRLPP